MKSIYAALAAAILIVGPGAIELGIASESVIQKSEFPRVERRSNLLVQSLQVGNASLAACCKVCTKGKACGNTCISQDENCHVGPGCACDG